MLLFRQCWGPKWKYWLRRLRWSYQQKANCHWLPIEICNSRKMEMEYSKNRKQNCVFTLIFTCKFIQQNIIAFLIKNLPFEIRLSIGCRLESTFLTCLDELYGSQSYGNQNQLRHLWEIPVCWFYNLLSASSLQGSVNWFSLVMRQRQRAALCSLLSQQRT